MRLAREPETARVVVEKLGFTQERSSRGPSRIAYGLELVNRSYELDALAVRVTLRFLDGRHHSHAPESVTLEGVPASSTFYVGGRARVAPRVEIRSFAATVAVHASRERRLVLPVAAQIRLTRDRTGALRVAGLLTNAFPKTLADASTVYAVIFDGAGAVIGGGGATIPSAVGEAVLPGHTAAFVIDGLSPTPSRRALFAGVSIDP